MGFISQLGVMTSSLTEIVMMQLLTKKQLLKLIPYSHTHVARLELDGKFPKRLKPYGGRNGKAFWVREEVDNWIQDQIDQRDNSHNAFS
jgi:predicted DNA-binding transcriptional regulator AlpA